MIEFGELQADLPTFQNSGAIKVDNVLPLACKDKNNKVLKIYFKKEHINKN